MELIEEYRIVYNILKQFIIVNKGLGHSSY